MSLVSPVEDDEICEMVLSHPIGQILLLYVELKEISAQNIVAEASFTFDGVTEGGFMADTQDRGRGRRRHPSCVEPTTQPPLHTIYPIISSLAGSYRAAHPKQGRTILEASSHLLMVHEWPINCHRFMEALVFVGLDSVSQMRELSEETRPKRSNIAGCIHLLQIWAWEHLHVGRPQLHVPFPIQLDGLSVALRLQSVLAEVLCLHRGVVKKEVAVLCRVKKEVLRFSAGGRKRVLCHHQGVVKKEVLRFSAGGRKRVLCHHQGVVKKEVLRFSAEGRKRGSLPSPCRGEKGRKNISLKMASSSKRSKVTKGSSRNENFLSKDNETAYGKYSASKITPSPQLILDYIHRLSDIRHPQTKRKKNIALGHLVCYILEKKYNLIYPEPPTEEPIFFTNASFRSLFHDPSVEGEESEGDKEAPSEPAPVPNQNAFNDIIQRFDTMETNFGQRFDQIDLHMKTQEDRHNLDMAWIRGQTDYINQNVAMINSYFTAFNPQPPPDQDPEA
ncbi:hypothetical protein M5K25_020883 [Dendrobium thyrsiflorum]|uniref:Aminotransferase-like plant mobile domain-containing protein n=1 Tax=Dendrobium thyrsiflorum TaxID=117978 RepID=A0ABD0UB09_DENTH